MKPLKRLDSRGHFVPNITIGPGVVRSLRKVTTLPFDVHLMIENPERYIQDFSDAGSDAITVHVEATAHLNRVVQMIKEAGAKAGVSLNPATPLDQVKEILPDIDLLLVMTVNPGFGGQKFIQSVLKKIEQARMLVDRLSSGALIEVDGGITTENIKSVADAGADVLVAGSSIFTSGDYRQTIGKMKKILNS